MAIFLSRFILNLRAIYVIDTGLEETTRLDTIVTAPEMRFSSVGNLGAPLSLGFDDNLNEDEVDDWAQNPENGINALKNPLMIGLPREGNSVSSEEKEL